GVFRSVARGLRALGLATSYGRGLGAAGEATPPASMSVPALPHVGVLPEYAAKAYLAALGIAVPPGSLAVDVAAAKATAADIGYPVALKAQSPSLTHKSDAGGVALGIEGERALAQAWGAMQAHMARRGLARAGHRVDRMAAPGLEM